MARIKRKLINKYADNDIGNNDFNENVAMYFNELKKYPPISREEENKLILRAKEGDVIARNKVISSNLRFVFNMAKKYRNRGVGLDDLIAEGNKAMMHAMEKFDPSQNVKFFTYAVWWIRQAMLSVVQGEEQLNRKLTRIEDICQTRDIDPFERYCSDEVEEETVNPRFIYDDTMTGEREESEHRSSIVERLMSSLDERERFVITKYFGIDDDGEGKTIVEISRDMGLSSERVRQIKVRALNVMRSEALDLNEEEYLIAQYL